MSLENLNPLTAESACFSHKVDWSIDPFDNSIRPNGTPIVLSNSLYEYQDGFVVEIVPDGHLMKLATASPGDIDLNFSMMTPLLVAANPDDIQNVEHAAIRIRFSSGVRGVGAYVSGYRKGVSTQSEQDHFIAQMWIRLAGSNEVLPCAGVGTNGPTQPESSEPTAPFVGAKSTGADIAEVCFDVAMFGNKHFDFVVIGDLWLIRS